MMTMLLRRADSGGRRPSPASPSPASPPPASPRPATGRRILAAAVTGCVVAGLAAVAPHPPAADAAAVGAGGYTESLPTGAALPAGCGDLGTRPRQFVTADAPAGPVPTNDWWSSLLFKKVDCAYSDVLHAHPAAYDTGPAGLGVSYTTAAQISGTATGVGEYHYPYTEDFTAGVVGLAAPRVLVDDWSDWTVTPYWSDGSRTMRATIGHGLPFAYFQITGGDALITTRGAATVWSRQGPRIGYTVAGHDYVAYAPTGATWSVSAGALTSDLAGKGYFSVAVLPTTPTTAAAEREALADSYGRYAHHHVIDTRVTYRYEPARGRVSTTYTVTTTAREGAGDGTVLGLYPHQWRALDGAAPITSSYVTARGAMKVLVGAASFTTAAAFAGVLPELPAVADSSGADLASVTGYLEATRADPLDARGADTYWTGKALGRAARIAEIADQLGRTAVRDEALRAIRDQLTDWLTAAPGEAGRLFYYDRDWGTLIGYPASYGSDQELNDHHFHYGYFVAAAATLARFDPDWASGARYGAMVDLLIRDANNYDRADRRFPYLRDFDIYAGHDWASGHGAFFAGNNQESSSEGMNFANALIQWGEATGDPAVRDAGVFIWTTQAAAVGEYWFDTHDENFPAAFGHGTVGMVWGDGGSYSTWFTAAPEMIQGINMLPVTGGHLYLGADPAYVRSNYAELVRNAGGEPTVWRDVLWSYLALGDADAALAKLRAAGDYTPEEGESRAHTFHWIRNLAALGTPDATVTADHPLARVFGVDGALTYVAANVTDSATTVRFSDGFTLAVPAGRTVAAGRTTFSGGSATGGPGPTTPGPTTPAPSGDPDPPSTDPPSTDPPSTGPSPTPPSPSGPSPSGPSPSGPSPSGPAASTAPATGAAVRYLQAGGVLAGAAGAAGSAAVARASVRPDDQPHDPVTFTASGVHLAAVPGAATAFDLGVDSGTAVGNGLQLRVSYDLTGDGTVERVETYRYFATDPVPGWERYTDGVGLVSATGAAGDLVGGTVRVQVWSAIGAAAATVALGERAVVRLPYR